jgi:plasmid segregation protein ParM
MNKISIDIGYSSSKIMFNSQYYKVPTAISFANDCGIEFGESAIYDFEGEKYYVGELATDEAFTTTDYKFLIKFAPLIVFHIFKKLGITGDISLNTGLALTDWSKREEFKERLNFLKVNNETVATGVNVVGPQGSGAYNAYIVQNELTQTPPKSLCVIDIGYRTINFLYYERGEAIQTKMKGFPGHGVVSIMKTFSNYLESAYGMPFSEQEALKIFMDKEFSLGGTPQEDIPKVIADLKNKFVQKLMNSVLVSEKKTLMMAEKVLIAGGGAYYIQDVPMPPNTVYNSDPKEFSNVYGYSLIG